jgi:hypothetical protein
MGVIAIILKFNPGSAVFIERLSSIAQLSHAPGLAINNSHNLSRNRSQCPQSLRSTIFEIDFGSDVAVSRWIFSLGLM